MARASERERPEILSRTDTVAALSSGGPPAAIAVIRISGARAFAAATALAGTLPPPRTAGLRALRNAEGGLLDRALVLTFPGPASATGEDLVELHCHGGRAVVEAVEAAILAQPELRRSEPGEFTRRALMNGRIDVIEAEGLADLLEAETETQRRVAIAAAEGQVSRALRGWADRIAALAAQVEAAIDYADEGEVGDGAAILAGITNDRHALAEEMAAAVAAPAVERWRDGIRVVIAGPPNAGKSTLVNLLAARDAAIVSPIAGTTRDRIEVSVRRGGQAYVLVDTAGLRDDTADPIEAQGIGIARGELAIADIVLWLDAEPAPKGAIVVRGKADLAMSLERLARDDAPSGWVSRDVPASIERLWRRIEARAPVLRDDHLSLTAQVRRSCSACVAYLGEGSDDPVLLAEGLRAAHRALAQALGRDATSDMLDALFSRFCLGK